jgi:alpha-1,6-mannosyltransferase
VLASATGLILAMAAAVIAARHAHPSEVSPVSPSGEPWNTFWTWGVVAAFVLYATGTWVARRGALSLRVAVITAVIVQTLPLAAPLLLSKDVYLYWIEARIAIVHHANPYRATPGDYPSDPAYSHVSEIWRTETAPYGPAWEALVTAPAAAAGSSSHHAELGYRVLALLGVLGTALIVARRTRNAAAVALLGWSPLVALHFAGGGHGDGWMTALLLLGVAAPAAAVGGAAWPIASAFKAVPAILLPLELAARRLRAPKRWWLGLIGATVVIVAAATAIFGPHWVTATVAGAHQTSPIGGVHWLTQLGLRHRYAVVTGGLAFAVVYLVLLRSAWRTGRARLSLAATALCLTSSLLRPWYALWPVALAAVEEDELAGLAALALSGYVLFADAVPF